MLLVKVNASHIQFKYVIYNKLKYNEKMYNLYTSKRY